MRQHLWMVLAVLGLVAVSYPASAQTADPLRVVGYFTSYSIYEDYFVTNIPAEQLTDLNYAFIDISDSGQCVSADTWTDTQFPYPGDKQGERLRGNFKQLKLLHEKAPDLRILMTVGGWEYSDKFSDVALTRESRIRFANSCIAFMRQYGFNGIDIDWRYPVSGGRTEGRPEDSENFILLLAELRGELDYWSQRDTQTYLLTITAPADPTLYQNFPLLQLQENVDWINLMSYGFQGEWSTIASHTAPLYGNTRDPRGEKLQQTFNVDAAVTAYLDAGVPANKIMVGIPFYAQAWRNVAPNDRFGLYSETSGIPYGTRTGGILYYRDLMPLLDSEAYIHFFDDETKSAWMYNEGERIAVSYEDPQSIQNKTAYVRSRGLGGVMVWELRYDDEMHTLLNAINDGLQNNP